MSTNEIPSNEEHRFKKLLAAASSDAVAPDEEFLKRLRKESTQVLIDQATTQFANYLASAEQVDLPNSDSRSHRPNRRWAQLAGLASGLTIAIALVLLAWLRPFGQSTALGALIARLEQADSLHLQILRDGIQEEVWIRNSQEMRLQRGPQRYRIVRGSKLWRIDESSNRVQFDDTNAFFREEDVDILAMLGMDETESTSVLQDLRPVERKSKDGNSTLYYETKVSTVNGQVKLEAVVDAKTRLVRWLRTKPLHDANAKPLSELRLLAFNPAIKDDKFLVSKSLTVDGRIGKIADRQGIVFLKPVGHSRWSPVCRKIALKPGDWLRTDNRGANAVAVELSSGSSITLGPGSLAEFKRPDEMHLIRGEAQISPAKSSSLKLIALKKSQLLKTTQIVRVTDKFARLPKRPAWLEGFEGTATPESLGSLIARVDGRSVPLTVGYHKVSVDIRDQVARTTIEESFVNHTSGRLEGVFYFPLPQDASISGFGMWINDELVEADIVEKQRAREIYETILRENRDPGLLEWTGGNVFKARVFPIFGHSEKRIKITYTQVLPLRNNRFSYDYGLQSEMLKTTPLRELSLDVKVHSTLPIRQIDCPTHAARISKTAHAGQVEFSAQDYSPSSDFEVAFELDSRQSDVVVIPHRRGDDGYFMMQLIPPSSGENWQRETIPDGESLDLLIIADTSASMDVDSRKRQYGFVASLLGSLTLEDTFNLAVSDVACKWIFSKSQVADEKSVQLALEELAKRKSLGWTDLPNTFDSAHQFVSDATSHIVYVGDGIVTAADQTNLGVLQHIQNRFRDQRVAIHAVSVGNTFDSTVFKGLASIGGGSVRDLPALGGPQSAAFELLHELLRPGLRDMKIEFNGVQIARVYPQVLPNLAAGQQQIILGRYLPTDNQHAGDVIVSGILNGEPVRYQSRISFADAKSGNSFIPRLWARMHLDQLLAQGVTSLIKDDIISLSEQYHIITPYTSMLVLETDADRERFKVNRRFQMRDGERYFAEGRDTAKFELLQQQMKIASDWRIGLRKMVLREFKRTGRDVRPFQNRGHSHGRPWHDAAISGGVYLGDDTNGVMPGFECMPFPSESPISEAKEESSRTLEQLRDVDAIEWRESMAANDGFRISLEGRLDLQPMLSDREQAGFLASGMVRFDDKENIAAAFLPELKKSKREVAKEIGVSKGKFLHDIGNEYSRYISWVDQIFPRLNPAVSDSIAAPSAKNWPAEAIEISKSLLRIKQLENLKGGIHITNKSVSTDPRWSIVTDNDESRLFYSPKLWLTKPISKGAHSVVHWCDEKQRGVYSEAFQLGRQRKSLASDLKMPLELQDNSLQAIHETYHKFLVHLDRQGETTTILVSSPSDGTYQIRFTIDQNRNVISKREVIRDGKVDMTTVFREFVQIADCWWATKIEILNNRGDRVREIRREIRALGKEPFSQQIQQQLASRDRVQFLSLPLPNVKSAKTAVAAGKANFDDHFALMLSASLRQDWQSVDQHLQSAVKIAAGKNGMKWIRYAILGSRRRFEEQKQSLIHEVRQIANSQSPHAITRAVHVYQTLTSTVDGNVRLQMLDQLESVYCDLPKFTNRKKEWRQEKAQLLKSLHRRSEALELEKLAADENPQDIWMQIQFAESLVQAGDPASGFTWLEKTLTNEKRNVDEVQSVLDSYARLLRQQGRYRAVLKLLKKYVDQDVANQQTYAQYLNALLHSNQKEVADTLVTSWFELGRRKDPISDATSAKLNAAIAFALGQGFEMYSHQLDYRWIDQLIRTARHFTETDSRMRTDIAGRIVNDGRVNQTEQGVALRNELAKKLIASFDELSIAQISSFVSWCVSHSTTNKQDWQALANKVLKKWENEQDQKKKVQWAQPLTQIYNAQFSKSKYIEFLRRQMDQAAGQDQDTFALQLFRALLGQTWSQETEAELFGLLPHLSTVKNESNRSRIILAHLHDLVDRLIVARMKPDREALMRNFALTRTELFQGLAKSEKKHLAELANQLKTEAAKYPKQLSDWFRIEQIRLLFHLGEAPEEIEETCWAILGDRPLVEDSQADLDDPATSTSAQVVKDLLRTRYLLALCHVVCRTTNEDEKHERLLKYVDHGLENDEDADFWRSLKYRILIAFDRPEKLESALRSWISTEHYSTPWRSALANLLAEQGNLHEAIRLYQAIEKDDQLTPAQYNRLAHWYLAENERQLYVDAKIQQFASVQEYRLSQALSRKLNPWLRNDKHLPTELDESVQYMFIALFKKSNSPQNYLHQLGRFYKACRDHRLLQVLPDAIVGQSSNKVYPFLENMDTVVREIRDESAADAVLNRIGKLRATTNSAVDLRALDLLEAIVYRKSSEIQNQPGPATEKAVAALQRAFKREWGKGEVRLMALFLRRLEKVSQADIAAEQLQELQALQFLTKSKFDYLLVTKCRAQLMFQYGKHDESITLLDAAINEMLDEIPSGRVNDAIETLIGFYENRNHFQTAEAQIANYLKRELSASQTFFLETERNGIYIAALYRKGQVSLGSGEKLYDALRDRLQAQIQASLDTQRLSQIKDISYFYRTAKSRNFKHCKSDLRDFAFGPFLQIVQNQHNQLPECIREMVEIVRHVLGARTALEFCVKLIETEPEWLTLGQQDTWSQHHYQMSGWRKETSRQVGELEGRLLAIVLRRLKYSLQTSRYYGNSFVRKGDSNFWTEMESNFAATAVELLKAHDRSNAIAQNVAHYYYHGLKRRGRAIEILSVAYDKGILGEYGQSTLVDYLQTQGRYGESIAILVPLIKRHPDSVQYRVYQLRAYYHTKRHQQLKEAQIAADKHFRDIKRRNERTLAQLASICVECKLSQEGVDYYLELIPFHQRTQRNRGIGIGTLSHYYDRLARGYADLKQTEKAVEAAASAMIAWGPTHRNRTNAIKSLEHVLRSADDVPAYISKLDQMAAETQQDRPIIRKAIGKVLFEQKKHEIAITQLKIAADLQPNDEETMSLLLKCFDATGDSDQAIQQLLTLTQFRRSNFSHYEELGKRLSNQLIESERAYTSIVEVLPSESESHELLAKIRQRQERKEEAILHWQKVAEIRALEPTGLVNLFNMQLSAGYYHDAGDTLKKLEARSWPSRFGDLKKQIRDLSRKLRAVHN